MRRRLLSLERPRRGGPQVDQQHVRDAVDPAKADALTKDSFQKTAEGIGVLRNYVKNRPGIA